MNLLNMQPTKKKEIPSVEEIIYDPMEIITKIGQLKSVTILRNHKSQEKVKGKGNIVIQENKVIAGLEYFYKQGSIHMKTNNYHDSLISLKQADIILCSAVQQDMMIDWRLFITIKLDLGICYYKVGFLEEAFNYMEKVLLFLKKKKNLIKQDYLFFKKRLAVQCYLQCCILLSELGKHSEAVEFSKMALKKIIQLITKIYEYIYNQVQCQEEYYSTSVLQILDELVMKFESLTSPILKLSCIKKIQILHNNVKKLQLEDQVDLEPFFKGLDSQWVASANILTFLQIKPLFLDEFQVNNQNEVESCNLIAKLALLTVSYYCVSTEGRFIEKENKIESDSENYLSHGLEVAFLFLPHGMPLVGQIISVHNKFHGLSKQTILEGKDGQPICTPEEFDLILLKQYIGQPKMNFFVPLIRKYKNQRHFSQKKPVNINLHEKFQDQLFEVGGPSTTTSKQKRNPQSKFDFPQATDTIERTKSAGRKTYTQQNSPQNNDQRLLIQEIYSSKGSTQKKQRHQDKLPNNTVQVNYPQQDFIDICQNIQSHNIPFNQPNKTKPVSQVTQRSNQNQTQFFSSHNQPLAKMQLDLFDRPRIDIQINNNFNILIKNNEPSKKVPVKPKQLDTEIRSRLFLDPLTSKNKQPRIFIARRRAVSQKQ